MAWIPRGERPTCSISQSIVMYRDNSAKWLNESRRWLRLDSGLAQGKGIMLGGGQYPPPPPTNKDTFGAADILNNILTYSTRAAVMWVLATSTVATCYKMNTRWMRIHRWRRYVVRTSVSHCVCCRQQVECWISGLAVDGHSTSDCRETKPASLTMHPAVGQTAVDGFIDKKFNL